MALNLSGCSKDNDLGPLTEIEDDYVPLKGDLDNNTFTRFAELYKKYNTYFIHQFTQNDIVWSLVTGSGGGNAKNCVIEPVQTAYVGKLLDWIDESFLSFYPESFLKKVLPYKIYLASTVLYKSGSSLVEWPGTYGGNSLIFGYGYSKLDQLTVAEKYDYFNRINRDFIYWIIGNSVIKFPDKFSEISDYGVNISSSSSTYVQPTECRFKSVSVPTDAMLTNGMLGSNSSSSLMSSKINTDIQNFLFYMRYFAENSQQWIRYKSFPKVKQKYDLLRSYLMDTYGFDPHALGNSHFE